MDIRIYIVSTLKKVIHHCVRNVKGEGIVDCFYADSRVDFEYVSVALTHDLRSVLCRDAK